MKINLSVLETIMLVVSSLFGGIILALQVRGDLESGFIYFGLIMFAVGILIMKNRTRKG